VLEVVLDQRVVVWKELKVVVKWAAKVVVKSQQRVVRLLLLRHRLQQHKHQLKVVENQREVEKPVEGQSLNSNPFS
jgi:hypothetical protein